MLQWRVLLLAALAVLLLVAGLVALILPEPYEGWVVYQFSEQHTFRALDIAGGGLLAEGCVVAWLAGFVWRRRMNDS